VKVKGSGFDPSVSVVVWFDANGNGTKESGEAGTTVATDSAGSFAGASIDVFGSPGSYPIRASSPGSSTVRATISIGSCWVQDEGCTINGAQYICLLGDSPSDMISDCKAIDSNYSDTTKFPNGWDLSNVGPRFAGAGVLAAAAVSVNPVPLSGCIAMTNAISVATGLPYNNIVPDQFYALEPTHGLLSTACGVPALGIPPFDLPLYLTHAAIEAALPGHHGLPDPALDDAAVIEAVVAGIQAAAATAELQLPGSGVTLLIAAQQALAAAAVDGAIACGFVNYYCNGSDITGNIIAHSNLQKQLLPFKFGGSTRWGDIIGWARPACRSNVIPPEGEVGECSTPDTLPNPGSAGDLNILADEICATGPIVGLSIGYDGDLSFDINDNPDPELGPGPAIESLTNYHNFQPGPGGSEPPSGLDIEIPLADRGLFLPTLEKLRIGTTVEVCGRWVADMHQSWNELHPVTSITILDETPPVIAPTVALVKDINPVGGSSVFGAGVNVNGVLFVAANDGVHGLELWKSDGTAGGTVLVKDIYPSGDSLPQGLEGTNVNGTLFFRAADGVHGFELWKSDGTAAGTVLVKDINPGAGTAFPQNMTNVNGVLFFTADDGLQGRELWMSDGTAAGTLIVEDINLGAGSSLTQGPALLTNVNGRLFFPADDGVQGRELWTSDGTEVGTQLVADFTPVPGWSSIPYELTNVNGTLYFGLVNWILDGVYHLNVFDLFTLRGLVKDINPPNIVGGALVGGLTNVSGTLFFTADDGVHGRELWRSNGSEGSTQLVKDIQPPTGASPSRLTNVNGTLFFVVSDGTQAGGHGAELWKSDGTEEGTVLVKDIYPGPSSSNPGILTNVNGTLFFQATDGIHGLELWMSDGSEAGTVLVADINPGAGDSNPSNLTNVNGTLFFQATDGIHGTELWATRSRVVQAESATGAGPVRFETSAGALINLQAVSESSLPTAGKPAGVTFPFGFFGWTIGDLTPGQMVTIRMDFPSAVPLPPQYWKVDNNGVWANLCLQVPCVVKGSKTLELTMTDGGVGDLDGTANGTIRDPGGPGSAGGSEPIPVANAGPDQTVDEGTVVTLDGSASTGSGLSFAWSQIAGPAVLLSSATSPTPGFTAPLLPGGLGANQTLTFHLTVSSGGVSSTDTVDISVRNANHPPVADAGADQNVSEESPVTLSAVNSFDPDGDPLVAYQWTQTGGPAVVLDDAATTQATSTAPLLPGGVGGGAVLTFQVTVSDGQLTSTDEVVVTVEQVNHPPIANAGADQTKEEGSPVTLNGAESSDPDGDPLTYAWSQVSGPPVTLSNPGSPTPSFTAPAVGPDGATVVLELVVSDGMATGGPHQVRINVLNVNDSPACNLAQPSRALLWPPNHKLLPVEILGVTDTSNGQVAITITGVTQDEPVNDLGDGDTSPDAVLQGSTVLLRAERAGDGDGRVYEVSFMISDGQGGSCTGSVRVGVPRRMKAETGAIDDGQLYDATQP
jgi:ELWxxDGT repeat protein